MCTRFVCVRSTCVYVVCSCNTQDNTSAAYVCTRCVCVCVCVCAYVEVYVNMVVCVYIYIYMYVCMYVCILMWFLGKIMWMGVCVCVCKYMCMCAYIYIYIYIYIRTHTHTYIYHVHFRFSRRPRSRACTYHPSGSIHTTRLGLDVPKYLTRKRRTCSETCAKFRDTRLLEE
jgi:hypothetical protein